MPKKLKQIVDPVSSSKPTGHRPLDLGRLLDNLPGLIAYVDTDLRFRYCNKMFASWRGFDQQAIIGIHLRDVVGKANYTVICRNLKIALAGSPVVYEYDHLHNGLKRHVRAQYEPDIVDGAVLGVLVEVVDLSDQQTLKARAEESETLFNDAFANAPTGLAVIDVNGIIERCNRSLASIFGLATEAILGQPIVQLIHPEDADGDVLLFHQLLSGARDGYKTEKRFLRSDGQMIDTSMSVSAMRNGAGEPVRFLIQIDDETEKRQAERKLVQLNARLSLAINALRGGFWHMDVASREFETSQALSEFIGGSGAPVLDLDEYSTRILLEDHQGADLTPLLEGRIERSSVEYRLQTINGLRWMRCDRQLLRGSDGAPESIVGVAIDISNERAQLAASMGEAETDSLTGLLNRRGLERWLARSRLEVYCGVIAVDLDGFKQVNDTLGHAAGDQVLIEVGQRLKATVRNSDLVARVGGDEFLVFLIDTDRALSINIAERINIVLRLPVQTSSEPVSIGASLGVAWSPVWPENMADFFLSADRVLYDAKSSGKNTYRVA